VTLEPCTMCAGLLIHSRVSRLVFGASEPRAGAVVSRAQVLDQTWMNHRIEVEGGVLAEECGEVLRAFFKGRR
jgi:tRNA(adenine34) deaminase